MQLKDKVIIITGGSAGIGLECAKAYRREGAKLAILSIGPKEIESALQQVGGGHLGIVCNVGNEAEVKSAIGETLSHFGRIDAIHNNAGIAHPSKAVHETTMEEWDILMTVNLKSVYVTTKYGFEALKESKGVILNTSSLVGEIGQTIHAAYAATKGGMNALTKCMALDYAPYGIRVNAIAPAGVWTDTLRQWANDQPNANEIEDYLRKIHPLGFCPEGDVIADAAVFLLSDKARFITGCILPVSGGAELGYRS